MNVDLPTKFTVRLTPPHPASRCSADGCHEAPAVWVTLAYCLEENDSHPIGEECPFGYEPSVSEIQVCDLHAAAIRRDWACFRRARSNTLERVPTNPR